MKHWLAAVALGLRLAGVAHAAIDLYEFAEHGDAERCCDPTQSQGTSVESVLNALTSSTCN